MPRQAVGRFEWFRIFEKRRTLNEAYHRVFGQENPDGQHILRHRLRTCYFLQPTYVQSDSHETSHREGVRRFLLSVIREANISQDQLMKMIEEQYDAGSNPES